MKKHSNASKTETTGLIHSRRGFLKTVLAATAGPMVLPYSRIFGETAPSNRLNLAIIGCGARAGYMRYFVDDATVRVLATVDPFKDRRESWAAHFNTKYGEGVCKPYADFREMIADPEIDAVLVSTPDHWHVPIALEAARHNKDIFVEKPLGVSLKDQFRLRQMFNGKGLVFQYGTQQRSTLFARTAVDLVRNGYIGEVERVDVWSPHLEYSDGVAKIEPEIPVPAGLNYDLFTGPSIKKPYTRSRCTSLGSWHCYEHALGFIAGWGSHPLDICQWGLDMDHSGPVRYEGTGHLPPEDDIFNSTRGWDIHCVYPNGIGMRFMDFTAARPVIEGYHQYVQNNGTTFFGSEGWVTYSRGACYYFKDGNYINVTNVEFKDSARRVEASDNHIQNFFDCIRSRKPTINPLESAIRSDTISHLSDIVVRTGKPVQWDPEAEEIVDGTPEQSALTHRTMREPYVV